MVTGQIILFLNIWRVNFQNALTATPKIDVAMPMLRSEIMFRKRTLHKCLQLHVYPCVHMWKAFCSNTILFNLALALYAYFLELHLTRFGKEVFICKCILLWGQIIWFECPNYCVNSHLRWFWVTYAPLGLCLPKGKQIQTHHLMGICHSLYSAGNGTMYGSHHSLARTIPFVSEVLVPTGHILLHYANSALTFYFSSFVY